VTERPASAASDHLGAVAAAEALGVSRQTLHRWERDGRIARVDPDGPPRFARDEVARVAAASGPRTPDAVRERIVFATAALVADEGTAACTIDGVAARAGLSRGGVLHHFPSKRDLLEATVSTFLHRFEARWQEAAAASDDPVTAYVQTTASPDDDLTAALLVCAVEEPDLLADVRRSLRRWYRRLDEHGGTEAVARALAADALWLYALLQLEPLPARLAGKVQRELAHPPP
jgi:AcrR family transcriptional regulator